MHLLASTVKQLECVSDAWDNMDGNDVQYATCVKLATMEVQVMWIYITMLLDKVGA